MPTAQSSPTPRTPSSLAWEKLRNPSPILAGRQSTKVNRPPVRFFLEMYAVCAMIVRPNANRSRLSSSLNMKWCRKHEVSGLTSIYKRSHKKVGPGMSTQTSAHTSLGGQTSTHTSAHIGQFPSCPFVFFITLKSTLIHNTKIYC